jgi:hypothetical protein
VFQSLSQIPNGVGGSSPCVSIIVPNSIGIWIFGRENLFKTLKPFRAKAFSFSFAGRLKEVGKKKRKMLLENVDNVKKL